MRTKRVLAGLRFVLVVLLVWTAFGVGPSSSPAAAFVSPVPVVPSSVAGVSAGVWTVGSMGMVGALEAGAAGCAASGVGCVVLAGGAAATAGYALGYYGASFACNAAKFLLLNTCEGYQWTDSSTEGLASSGFVSCDRPEGSVRCARVGWESLIDLGPGSEDAQFAGRLTNAAEPVAPPAGWWGCVASQYSNGFWKVDQFASSYPHVSNLSYCNSEEVPDAGFDPLLSAKSSPPHSDGFFDVVLSCSGTVIGFRNCGLRAGDMFNVYQLADVARSDIRRWLSEDRLVGTVVADPVVQARGDEVRLRVTATCVTPGGVETTRYGLSPWVFESEGPDMPPLPCVETEIARKIWTDKETTKRGGTGVDTERIVEWEAPSEWLDPEWAGRECLRGNKCRPTVVEDPADPDYLECKWGGLVLASTECSNVPDVVPRPGAMETDPSPATTVPPAPATTVAPPPVPEGADDCVGAHCVGGPSGPVPEGSEGSECLPSGWGWFNPIDWVLKPIKCALVWAFWDQTAADEIGELSRDNGWTSLVADSSITTSAAAGPCIQLDAQEICSSSVLGVTAPAWVSTLLGALIAFYGLFEVIGLFSRITRT